MELRHRLDPRKIFVGLYIMAFAAYIIIGLQPADAANYNVTGQLSIPSINLTSDVTEINLHDHKLDTPDTIVGSYSNTKHKTLLIGHSTTIFTELDQVHLKDQIIYNNQAYRVTSIDMIRKQTVNMSEILSETNQDTIVIMTCAGQLLGGGDATHRLMLTAIRS